MIIQEALSFDDVMLVPQTSELQTRRDADISSEVVPELPVLVPIISANMPSVTNWNMAVGMHRAGGYSILHRFNTIEEQAEEYLRVRSFNAEAGVAIGLADGLERIDTLHGIGARTFALDVAHADSWNVFDFLHEVERQGWAGQDWIVGNLATRSATIELITRFDWIDALKVGIGPGAACITREVTGFGVPQLSAIRNVREALDDLDHEAKLIADGGIKNSGDIVKALAAGADTVMLGRLLAGCDEAPEPGVYYGSASAHLNSHHAPEGVYGDVQKTGPVEWTMKKLAWGIRSGVSYGGGTNLKELRSYAQWLRVSPLSAIETGVRL